MASSNMEVLLPLQLQQWKWIIMLTQQTPITWYLLNQLTRFVPLCWLTHQCKLYYLLSIYIQKVKPSTFHLQKVSKWLREKQTAFGGQWHFVYKGDACLYRRLKSVCTKPEISLTELVYLVAPTVKQPQFHSSLVTCINGVMPSKADLVCSL